MDSGKPFGDQTARIFFYLIPFALFWVIISNYQLMAHLLPNYALYDIKRILELLLFVITVFSLFFYPFLRRIVLMAAIGITPWVRLALLAVLFFGLLSSSLAVVPRYAFLQVATYFFMFVFGLMIAGLRCHFGKRFDRALLAIIFLGIVIYEATFICEYIRALMARTAYHAFPGYVNLRFLAQVLSWTLPLTALPFLSERVRQSEWLRTGFFLVGALWWMIFWVNQSKGLTLMLIPAVVLILLCYRKSAITAIQSLLLIMGSGMLLWLAFFKYGAADLLMPAKLVNFGLDAAHHTMMGRWLSWKRAFAAIYAHPVLGLGPLHFDLWTPGIPLEAGLGNPHNSILQLAMSWGLPAVLLVLGVVVFAWLKWFGRFSEKTICGCTSAFHRGLLVLLPLSVVLSLFYSLGSIVIFSPASQVLMSVMIGWLYGLYLSAFTPKLPDLSLSSNVLIIMTSMLFLVLLLGGVLPEVFYLPRFALRYLASSGFKVSLTPGFWQWGIFSPKGFY